jgi:hypothetical protein
MIFESLIDDKFPHSIMEFSQSDHVINLSSFFAETYHMIDQCDSSIASWSPDGSNFIIHDTDAFSKVSNYGKEQR